MKNIKHIVLSLFVIALIIPSAAFAQGGVRGGGKAVQLNKAKFEAEIKELFDGNAMGYQVILLKNGQIVSETAGGWARVNNDGSAKMTVNTPANIGSTAKFFAGTALLRKFEQPSPIGGGMDSWLAQPFYKYLPKIYQDNMHPSIKQITFKDLLQHKAGFIHNDPTADTFFEYLKKGVSNDKTKDFYYGKSKYANANITTIGYVLAAIDNPTALKTINDLVIKNNMQPEDMRIQQYLGNLFEIQVETGIFKLSKPSIAPSCDAPKEFAAKNIIYAKTYRVYNDIAKGSEASSKAGASKACHGAGGWYISGRELAAYVANVTASENIISSATRNRMFNDNSPSDRLLWSFTVGDSSLAKNFGWDTTPYMGGDHGGAHATIAALPNGYYAIGIVNSDIALPDKSNVEGGSNRLTRNIVQAFNAGMADNF